MKIDEVFEKLIENPKDVYECLTNLKRSELRVIEGFFYLKSFRGNDELSPTAGSGGFNGNFTIDSDWKLKRQPVDFMTAVKAFDAGKKIKCDSMLGERIYGGITKLTDNNHIAISDMEILRGKWFILDDSPKA